MMMMGVWMWSEARVQWRRWVEEVRGWEGCEDAGEGWSWCWRGIDMKSRLIAVVEESPSSHEYDST